jgi:twitching motility protein PilT
MDLDLTLRRAIELGASDVHLKVDQPPIMRQDGLLQRMAGPPLGSADLSAVLDQITFGQRPRREEFDETGELDLAYAPRGMTRFRVAGFRQRGAISFAFRMISDVIPSIAALRLPPGVERLADEHQGLILITGTTGSGKTTTLASMVDHINRTRQQHIITIEDPVEMLHSDRSSIVNQRDVGMDTSSYQEALRRALRQDPDVIVIGELRDDEAAQVALGAAESGHLVLTTLHTTDAEETVKRMVDYFPAVKQPLVRNILGGVLRGVISQRLLPKIGGGRVVAVEVMANNARIAEVIREGRPHEIPDAIKDGEFFDMRTMTHALIELVVAGELDSEIAAAAAPNRHDFIISLRHALQTQRAAAEVAAQESESPAPDEPVVAQVRGPGA